MQPQVIKIGDVEYVRKDSLPSDVSLTKVIVRTYSAGVFFGDLLSKKGNEVVLKNARRLWYWSGAASLSQLAVSGTSSPEKCKFPVAVPEVTLTEVIEIIPCTKVAIDSINSVKTWAV